MCLKISNKNKEKLKKKPTRSLVVHGRKSSQCLPWSSLPHSSDDESRGEVDGGAWEGRLGEGEREERSRVSLLLPLDSFESLLGRRGRRSGGLSSER